MNLLRVAISEFEMSEFVSLLQQVSLHSRCILASECMYFGRQIVLARSRKAWNKYKNSEVAGKIEELVKQRGRERKVVYHFVTCFRLSSILPI